MSGGAVRGCAGDGVIYVVEQGPVSLACLLTTPPWWFVVGALALTLTALGLAAYVLHRDGFSDDVKREMAEQSALVGSIVASGSVLKSTLAPGYVPTVALSFAIGLAAMVATRKTIR
jgi:hypothetical protein